MKLYKNIDGESIELTEEEIKELKKEEEEFERINFPILKQNRISDLKTNCSNHIYAKYPIFKQLNIANGLVDGKEEMTLFINRVRAICDNKEEEITKANTREELEAIDIDNFNTNTNNNV